MGNYVFVFIVSHIAGSIPFGVLIGKIFYRTDVRDYGSKNPGATNVWRVLGKTPGILTLLLDIAKGAVPVLLAKCYFSTSPSIELVSGLGTILGHNWSLFLKGRGGKGVATSAGVFLALLPFPTLLAIAAFAVTFFISKIVSIGSMTAAITLIGTSFFFKTPSLTRVMVLLAAVLIIVKHIPNLKRLTKGEEPKVNF